MKYLTLRSSVRLEWGIVGLNATAQGLKQASCAYMEPKNKPKKKKTPPKKEPDFDHKNSMDASTS